MKATVAFCSDAKVRIRKIERGEWILMVEQYPGIYNGHSKEAVIVGWFSSRELARAQARKVRKAFGRKR